MTLNGYWIIESKKLKVILAALENSLTAKLTYLCREAASVYLEIVGKLLTVKGYQKGIALRPLSL